MKLRTNKDDNAFLPPTGQGEIPMTKHELFAAMAMQGINSNPECYGMSSQDKATRALQDADALINALNEQK